MANKKERPVVYMKILFWILAVVSILIGLFVSVVCYMSHGLGLTGTGFGKIVCMVGMLAAVVCVICTVLDNIGFVLMDLNGDNLDELVIGAVAQAGQQGNAVFCIYSDPQNPSYVINGVEGKLYYLHPGEVDGTYEAEIVGQHSAWVIETAERENTFDFNLKEGAMDPASRMTLDLIPFSSYK
jgi:hypothetical protein